MTPGQVALETFKASVGFYIAPWRFLESEWQAAWEAVANAVSGNLIADNERLRRQLARVVGDHAVPSDCYATGPLTGDDFIDLISCPSCEALNMLAQPAPSAVAKGGAV